MTAVIEGASAPTLLLGASGRLGWELARALAPLGRLHAPPHGELDVTDASALAQAVRSLAPRWIVNATAYNDVDRAEAEPAAAQALNAEVPARLAALARELGATLLHYSTDQVFDGGGEAAHAEDAPTAPINAYGRSKRDGEDAVRAGGCRHLIVRTAWLHAPRGAHFARTVIERAMVGDSLEVVADQWGAPTAAELVADVSAHLLRAGAEGTLHVVAGGDTSRHAYAEWVLARARELGWALRARTVRAVPSSHWRSAAPRPRNARLDTTRLAREHGLRAPEWRIGAERTLREMAMTQGVR